MLNLPHTGYIYCSTDIIKSLYASLVVSILPIERDSPIGLLHGLIPTSLDQTVIAVICVMVLILYLLLLPCMWVQSIARIPYQFVLTLDPSLFAGLHSLP